MQNKCRTIPPNLLLIPKVDTNRTISSQKEATIFMLDLYKAYEQCVINLRDIKKLDTKEINNE